MFHFRPAQATDAPQISEVLRFGFPEDLLPYTIFGCPGIAWYLSDALHDGGLQPGDAYLVCADGADVVGFAEIRWTSDLLFLNHLFVLPAARGHGLGTRLFLEGLKTARTLDQHGVQLDVFADNLRARKWYESLGFVPSHQRLWVEVALSGPMDKEATWDTRELAQADAVHAVYGFSEFTLQTRAATYRVGRLGGHLFRSLDGAILSDPQALGALARLDPNRKLLCITRNDSTAGHPFIDAIVRARSFRMAADVDEVLERLSCFRTF